MTLQNIFLGGVSFLACLSLLGKPVWAQEGTVSRTSRGVLLGTVNGEPRYREASGWDDMDHFEDPQWALEYGTDLGDGQPWTVVFQSDRTNNGLSVRANQLTFDLDGHTYRLKGYLSDPGNVFHPSLLNVSGAESGASLRVTNGTLEFEHGFGFLRVGRAQSAGLLIVEDARVNASTVEIGAAANSPGTVTLAAGGELHGGSSRPITIGAEADGTVRLVGSGSELITPRALNIGNAASGAVGRLVVAHPDARVQVGRQLVIENPLPVSPSDVGLAIHAGRVEVGDLYLAMEGGVNSSGVVLIDGGSLRVNSSIAFDGDGTASRLLLHGGELTINSSFNPSELEDFYWKSGTLRYSNDGVTLSQSRIVALTKQGALSYQGKRAPGTIATGQTLAFAADGTLHGGEIGLAGGTIAAGETLKIHESGSLAGYGTIDATLTGTGSVISSDPGEVLAIGALGGTGELSGEGTFRVGHLGIDATYGGAASGSGGFHKVGEGVQKVTGTLANSGGIFVEAGTLAMAGSTASLSAPQVSVAEGGHLQFLSGASGSGSITNDGWITNNGVITGEVTGGGRLSGSGRIDGVVDILGGGTLAPGNSVGSLAVSDLTLHGGATLAVEIAAAEGTAGVDWDLVNVEGALQVLSSVDNPVIVALQTIAGDGSPGLLARFDPTGDYSWQILAASLSEPDEWASEQFLLEASDFANLPPGQGGEFSITGAADGLYLNYSGVQSQSLPEPGGALLLAAAGLGLLLLRWHQRRGVRTRGATGRATG